AAAQKKAAATSTADLAQEAIAEFKAAPEPAAPAKPEPVQEPERFPPGGSGRFSGGRFEQREDLGSGGQVRIFFDQTPHADMIRKLREAGFRWNSPIKAWVQDGPGARGKAAEVMNLLPVERKSAEERVRELEQRRKEKQAELKGKRSVRRSGINAEIRTIDDMLRKLEGSAQKERLAREEAATRKDIRKAIEQGARQERILAHIATSGLEGSEKANVALRQMVREEVKKQGITFKEVSKEHGAAAGTRAADELENEATRFYRLGTSDVDPGLDAEKTSVATFVKAA